MKSLFAATIVALGLSLAPAMAGEGNGEPFPNYSGSYTTTAAPRYADTGSAAYPNIAGRPGSNLPSLAGDVLPTNGSESVVQTANSLPSHFEEGTVAYAQATQIHNWMVAHATRNAPAYASATRLHTPGG